MMEICLRPLRIKNYVFMVTSSSSGSNWVYFGLYMSITREAFFPKIGVAPVAVSIYWSIYVYNSRSFQS